MIDRVDGPIQTGILPASADVVIVGGGIIGLSCAHYLEQHGRSPLVIERGEVGRGSSYGNAGLVAPSHSIPLPAPGVVRQALRWLADPESPFFIRPRLDPGLLRWLVRFAFSAQRKPMLRGIPVLRDLNRLSAALYAELARDPSEPSLGYQTGGVINVYRTERGLEHGCQEAALLERYGVPSQVIEGEHLLAAEPALNAGLAGGVLWPEDGFIDPAAFVGGWRTQLVRRGVQLLTDTEVLAVGGAESAATVRTTAGTVCCRDVVIAAGAWSAALLSRMGHRLAIQPAKGYSVTVQQPASRLRRPLLLVESKVALTPMGDALRIAGTMELGGLDQSIDLRRMDAVRRAADPYLRAGSAGVSETIWTGLRSLSADGLPMIGRIHSMPSVAVASGHGHIGVSLAPVTGKLIAELLSGEKPSVDIAPLRPDR
jgi:D-amino-acid dehydrogenase